MTRKEAIEKVRSWSLPKETREILEALAPELRESKDKTKSAIGLIAEERERQISKGFNWRHDDEHDCHQLSDAAIVYAAPAPLRYQVMSWWPWDKKDLKEDDSFTTEGRIGELVKAGALIVAEIERLQRTVSNVTKPNESEDERIRQWLYDLIANNLETTICPFERENVLAYLEKQKEQKVDVDKLRKDIYQSGYNDGYQHGKEDVQKEQNGEDEESTDFTIYHPLKNGEGKYKCIPYSFYGSLTSFSEDKDLIDFLRTCFYTEEECNEWIEQQKLVYEPFDVERYDLTEFEKELVLLLRGARELNITDEEIIFNVKNQIAPELMESIKEKQKPIQEIEPTPIFRIGDILKRKSKDYTFRVDRIQGGYYHCDRNHGAFFPIEEQGNWELVEQKPVEKEIILTSFEEALNAFLFNFAHSPIEDCEPKEYIKKYSAEILKAAYKELNAKLQQDIFEAEQKGRREGYEVAKAEQEPAEWSEEDENKIERLAFLVSVVEEKEMISSSESIDLRNFIKSLRPQPKRDGGDDYNKGYINGRAVALKESWKPSEEQMYALAKAVTLYGGGLDSLYQDLRKLKGGVAPMKDIDE